MCALQVQNIIIIFSVKYYISSSKTFEEYLNSKAVNNLSSKIKYKTVSNFEWFWSSIKGEKGSKMQETRHKKKNIHSFV